jgi:hypothetical protein
MNPLTFPQHQITENGGPEVIANVAQCHCDISSDVFQVYQVAGLGHFHIECVQCGNAYCPFNLCVMTTDIKAKDPIHSDEQGWYFWDETWVNKYGPFGSEAAARTELGRYVEHLNSTRG